MGESCRQEGGRGSRQKSVTFCPTMKDRGLYTIHFNLLNGAAVDGGGHRRHTDRRRAARRGGFSLVLSSRTCALLSLRSTRASAEEAAEAVAGPSRGRGAAPATLPPSRPPPPCATFLGA